MKKVTLKNGFVFIGRMVFGRVQIPGVVDFSVSPTASREINPCYSFGRGLLSDGNIKVGLYEDAITSMVNC